MIHEYPLNKANRIRLAQAFRSVQRVDLALDCLVEGQMGKAFVDDLDHPTAFRAQVGPFVYFAGEAGGPAASEMLASLPDFAFLMPSSPGWVEAARAHYGPLMNGHTRYSFSSESLAAGHLAQLISASQLNRQVRRADLAFAGALWGKEHWIDLSDFESPEDFIQRGICFYMEEQGETCAAAFSSLSCSRGIEVSIFVLPTHRRQGRAALLAASLLLWCLQHNLEPHWDAANNESCRLASKLGYTLTGAYPAYLLVQSGCV